MNKTTIEAVDVETLNEVYSKLSVYQRVEKLYEDFDKEDIMLTSSFAGTSAFLLKVFSDINKDPGETGYISKNELKFYMDHWGFKLTEREF